MKSKPAAVDPRPKSEQIEAEIESKRMEQSSATEQLERLRAAEPNMLRSATDEEFDAHDRAKSKLSRTIARAAATEGHLYSELAKAKAWEEHGRCQAFHERGLAAAAKYQALVTDQYTPLAEKLADVLDAMQQEQAAVRAANKKLPEGQRPIDADAFRHPPYERGTAPEKEIEEEYWVGPDGEPCNVAFIVNGGVRKTDVLGAVQRKRLVPNPAYLAWRPNVRHRADSILDQANLPSAAYGEAAHWGKVGR